MTSSHLPTLAIVGRPNVGKSALFNAICKQRIAIVDEAEGVTRDRIYSEADIFGFRFRIIDTGGLDSHSTATYQEAIRKQAQIAIEEADVIVLVVDAQVGITLLDEEMSRLLHRTKKPVTLAVNKVDSAHQQHLQYVFRSLGFDKVIGVSASHGYQIAELLEAAWKDFKPAEEIIEGPKAIKVAVVGRPNVGKSSLINNILHEERCIVSPVAGTTRDSIDTSFTYGDTLYTFIDTAGIRRKGSEHEVVDKFAAIRTERAIERADVCLLVADAQEGMTVRDKKIANMIEEAGKGCILLFNKWDLVKGFRMEHCLKGVEEEAPFLKHCPSLCISALSGRNVDKIFAMINEVNENANKQIGTAELNSFIAGALERNHPPMIQGKRLRIYYMTQVSKCPPEFVTFVNYPNLMLGTYKKYLYNQFREAFSFTGVPIRLHMRGKARERKAKAAEAE